MWGTSLGAIALLPDALLTTPIAPKPNRLQRICGRMGTPDRVSAPGQDGGGWCRIGATTIWRSIRQNGMHWRRTPVARDAVARQVEGDVTEGHEPAAGLRLVSAYRIAQVCLRGWQVRLGDSSRPSPASARRWMSCRIRTVALDMAYFSTTSAQKTAGSTAVSLDPDDHAALCLRGDRARVAVQPRRNHRRHVRGSPPQSLLAARARADDP